MINYRQEEPWENALDWQPIRRRLKRKAPRPNRAARGIASRGRRHSVLKRFHGEQLPAESLPVALISSP